MGDTDQITLVCLDLAGTTGADDGIVERAFAEALVTQSIVSGTDGHARAVARAYEGSGGPKLDVFRAV